MRSILILEDHKREIKEKYIDIIEQKKKKNKPKKEQYIAQLEKNS